MIIFKNYKLFIISFSYIYFISILSTYFQQKDFQEMLFRKKEKKIQDEETQW